MSFTRRTNTENIQVGSLNDPTVKRYYDQVQEVLVVKIFSGDIHVSEPGSKEMLITVLGSCVAACIRDPIARVGGMNHFLLPDDNKDNSDSARYGAYAMEKLINELLKKGALKSRLEVKVFGGGNVIKSSAMVGDRNAQFVQDFCRNEGLPITTKHLGGDLPRRLHYYPLDGKAMMRLLKRQDDIKVVESEMSYAASLKQKPTYGDAELF